ncbi:MAG: urease subunit beta [Snodgrassella sp.]|nr:urease subunit beta [Snodgrassella sp.]
MIPGEYILAAGDIIANQNRRTLTITVVNRGDRPIQVGSHYHFYETNNALEFEREQTRGMRLNIPSGNAVRFEPGEAKTVALTEYGGHKKVFGFHNAVNGSISNK